MKLAKRDLILLAILGVVAVLGGLWWFVIKPADSDLSARRDELAQIQSENNGLRDTVARMAGSTQSEARRAADRLRLAKALPETTQAPAVVVQLQRLADRANVELTSIKTDSYSDYGTIRATQFEVRVTGRYFDVDDFLYRLHRQVEVNDRDRPVVGGRLFATTAVDLSLSQTLQPVAGGPIGKNDRVVATLTVVAFSNAPAGAAPASPASTPGSPVSAPTTTAPATTTPATTTAPAAGGGAGSAPSTARPSSGGAQ